jgi:hypothetical protein
LRYAQKVDNFMLEEDEAMAMARADDDLQVWDLDWRTGRRNDPPPLNGKVTT